MTMRGHGKRYEDKTRLEGFIVNLALRIANLTGYNRIFNAETETSQPTNPPKRT